MTSPATTSAATGSAERAAAPHRRLAAALAQLHRTLLNAQATNTPLAGNPYALLQAVMADPEFQWLRALSGLMAEIDEAGARGATPSPEALSGFIARAGDLAEGEGEFRDRLGGFLFRPEVAVAAEALGGTLSELRRAAN